MQDLVYGWHPVVSIFANGADELDLAAAAVEAVGGRVGFSASVEAGLRGIENHAADAVMVRASDGDAHLARLLDRLNRDAEGGRGGSVVVIPEALIDFAMDHAPHDRVSLICRGTQADELDALREALSSRSELVLEERGDEPPGRLRQFREEVSRIARTLTELSGEEEAARTRLPAAPRQSRPETTDIGATLRGILRVRRMRDQFFPPDLFADPAWDMLLDLMLARVERRLVAVSSLCIAASVPPTTALRWIKRLTDEGLFIRSADPRDGRRIYIDLSEACAEQMAAYLQSLAQSSPRPD